MLVEEYLDDIELLKKVRKDVFNNDLQFLTDEVLEELFKVMRYEECQQSLYQKYQLLNVVVFPRLIKMKVEKSI